MAQTNRTILITGATSGIGKACAEKFASAGNNLIITGRRADRLTELKNSLEKDFKIQVLELVFDVQNKDEVFAAIHNLPGEWKAIDILINNAGYYIIN